MDEQPPRFNLLLVKSGHELHVLDAIGQLPGLVVAVWDERLELTERHAGRAPYEY